MNNKSTGLIYLVVWLSVVALYNIIVFSIPEYINDVSRFTPMFWAGYGLMMTLFVAQLITTVLALNKLGPTKQLLFRLPLLKTSIVSTVIVFPISILFMIFPNSPTWVGVILMALVIFGTVVMYARALLLPAVVEGVEKQIRVKSVFIKSLTADAEALLRTSDNEEINKSIENVYEMIRYSDPLSVDEVAAIEANITSAFLSFKEAIDNADEKEVKAKEKLLNSLINQRNTKVKLLK